MQRLIPAILSFTLVVMMLALPMQEAEAKRFGGGGSFGSKSGYRQNYQRSLQGVKKPTPTAAQGRRGGFGTLLGGLAAGGLLAALFMGGGFEHINLFDMVILGLLAYMLFRLFAARRQPQPEGPYSSYSQDMPEQTGPRSFDTNLMFRRGDRAHPDTAEGGNALAYDAPAGFDEADFLRGAQAAYRQLQQAWDAGELSEIRALVTDPVFAEIQQQLRQRMGINRTDILHLEARLLEVRHASSEVEATVLFDALLREIDEEQAEAAAPRQVREVWHFTRPLHTQQPTWYLDGIQQLQQ